MLVAHLDYEIDDSVARVDFARVYAWLCTTYWWQYGLTHEKTERGARHSALVVGAYDTNGTQIGYARVVSDTIRFAWLADVFVEPTHRAKGLARAMVRFALEHPTLAEVTRWTLATRDAHAVYAPFGFSPFANPQEMMELSRPPAKTPTGI
jgi:GNAT superfamily N-acetyltransferase